MCCILEGHDKIGNEIYSNDNHILGSKSFLAFCLLNLLLNCLEMMAEFPLSRYYLRLINTVLYWQHIFYLKSPIDDFVTGQGLDPEWVRLGPACGVRIPDFMQERFHNTSPGDLRGCLLKLGQWNKEGLRTEGTTGESLGGAALALEMLWETSEPRWGCWKLTGESEKRGPWGQVQGVSPGRAAAAHCSPGCKSCGDP